MRILFALIILVSLSGCTDKFVIPFDDDTFMSYTRGGGFGASTESLTAEATSEAEKYCGEQGKSMHLEQIEKQGGNPGKSPESRIYFTCQ